MIAFPRSLNITAVKMKSTFSGRPAVKITMLEKIGREKFALLLLKASQIR